MSDEPRDAPAGQPLWHGRFATAPAADLLAYTVSLPFDVRLAHDDLAGSRAHTTMLAAVGLLTEGERDAIHAALDVVGEELRTGAFAFTATDEDVHTAVERRVTELAPDAGGKLHTARSRNDQVATDLRLFLRRAGREQVAHLHRLQEVLLERAEQAGDARLPGYTHLQRAQPVLLAHHLLAHLWALGRDVDRWRDCLARADESPLGAGALAGTSLPIDPQRTADELGFARTFANSLDAVSDRDFVAEALFVCSMVAVHCSRIGEEVVWWASEEVGFVELADEYATGSSMMPQKKNPDIAELARGKAGRVVGSLTGLLVTLKGLPLAYNRDLQEDKEPLFDALDTCAGTLGALAGLLATATFRTDRMADAADAAGAVATDLAEWLVERGMPFRAAHAVVGGLVRESLAGETPLADLVAAHPDLGEEAAALLAPGAAVARRRSPGGGGPEPLGAQLAAARSRLGAQAAWLAAATARPPAR